MHVKNTKMVDLENNMKKCKCTMMTIYIEELELSILEQETLEYINPLLQNLGESPHKLHAIAPHYKLVYAKRKYVSTYVTLKSKVSKMLEK